MTGEIKKDQKIIDLVRKACKDTAKCGMLNISLTAVENLLRACGADIRIERYWTIKKGFEYKVISKLDGGVYGYGKTPVESLARCLQMFPYFRGQVLGHEAK